MTIDQIAEDLGKTAEELAEAIDRIDAGVSALRASRLNQRVIILLIKDRTGLPLRDIEFVLNALGHLKSAYLKEAPKVKK